MSSNDFELEVTPRMDAGKGASRRLRRLENKIPAIIYGAGKDPQPVSIDHDSILHAAENEAFFSHIITLKHGKEKVSVVVKDLQRHPSRPFIVHADFYRVSEDQELHVNVPLHFINEDKCIGVKQHEGQVSYSMYELEISCLPKHLPEYLEVDLADLDIGDALHISELKLPEGVTSVDLSHGEDYDHMVVSVHKMQEMMTEEEKAEEEELAEAESAEAEAEAEGEAEEGEAEGEEKSEGDESGDEDNKEE